MILPVLGKSALLLHGFANGVVNAHAGDVRHFCPQIAGALYGDY